MTVLKRVRFYGESILARLGLLVIPRLPRTVVLALARLSGSLAFLCAGKLRRVALANLDLAFGAELSAAEKRRIARQSFQTVGITILDLFWFARDNHARIAQYVAVDDLLAPYVSPAPIVGVTAHFGNWEMLAQGLRARGHDHVAVAAPLANPDIDKLFVQRRNEAGVDIIQKKGALRGLIKALKNRRHVALLLDQNTKPEEGGVFVELFGLPIPMSNAAGMLAEKLDLPVVVLFCMTRPDGSYLLYALPPFKADVAVADRELAARQLTARIAQLFEGEIRKHPEQWLWMYKRWKYVAPGRRREEYPYYAKFLPVSAAPTDPVACHKPNPV